MVRSIGIDPAERVVHVVELDGSYRKTRLLGVQSAPIGTPEDPMRPDVIAEAVREAFDEQGMKGEIAYGVPCREAVLRTIELPFKGSDAIQKVVKSEIEGEIYTHSVDDMVVDFHEIGEGTEGGTRVLVAAVPKLSLRNQLTSLEAHQVEPEVVDLDTMALWRAADWAGAFELDEDDGEDGVADIADPVHAVVDLGMRSVKIVLAEGDNLIEMRALRLGDAVVAEHVAKRFELGIEQAQWAIGEALRTGADVHVDPGVALPALAEEIGDGADSDGADSDGAAGDGADDASEAPTMPAVAAGESILVTHAEVEAAHTRFLQRLARELTRFLTAVGVASRIRSLSISGHACRAPGMVEMLTAVFGVEPRELDVLGKLAHDLDEEEAAEISPQLAIAVGHALGRLGGPEGFQLRQEDLALTKGFERIKFPLAIACMVALLTVFVFANKKSMELRTLKLEIGQQFIDPNKPKEPLFHGLLLPIFNSHWFEDKNQFALKNSSGRVTYSFKDLFEDVAKAPVHQRIQIVRNKLREVAEQKQKESGVYEDVTLESGLAVLVRWAEILKGVEPQLGRYLVPSVDMSMRTRKLEFTVAFRDEGEGTFRARRSALRRAIEVDLGKPDSPFTLPSNGQLELKEKLFRDTEGTDVSGAYYDIVLDIKEQFPAFGPSARVGALAAPARTNDYLAAVSNGGSR